MIWHPDVPDIPINKPEKIEDIEGMDKAELDSLPFAGVDSLVTEAARAVADAYAEQGKDPNYERCVEIVSVALQVTGAGIGTQVGRHMTATSDEKAHEACRIQFPAEE